MLFKANLPQFDFIIFFQTFRMEGNNHSKYLEYIIYQGSNYANTAETMKDQMKDQLAFDQNTSNKAMYLQQEQDLQYRDEDLLCSEMLPQLTSITRLIKNNQIAKQIDNSVLIPFFIKEKQTQPISFFNKLNNKNFKMLYMEELDIIKEILIEIDNNRQQNLLIDQLASHLDKIILQLLEQRTSKKRNMYEFKVKQKEQNIDFNKRSKSEMKIKDKKKYQLDVDFFEKNQKFPLLLIDPDLTILRIELLQNKADSSSQFEKRKGQFFTLNVSSYYEKIFGDVKQIIKQIICNQKNGFLKQYVNFAKQYNKYYKKYFYKQGEKIQNIQELLVTKILIQGIDSAKIIIQPLKDIYGFTWKRQIFFNLNSFFTKIRKNVPILEEQFQKLLKQLMSLTILHQLAHYLIRQLGFNLSSRASFSKEKAKKHQEFQKKIVSGQLMYGSFQISIKCAQFFSQNKQLVRNYVSSQYESLQIDKRYKTIITTIFCNNILKSIKIFSKIQNKMQLKSQVNTNMTPEYYKILGFIQNIIKIQNNQLKEILGNFKQFPIQFMNFLYRNMPIQWRFLSQLCQKIEIEKLSQITDQKALDIIKNEQILQKNGNRYQIIQKIFVENNIYLLEKKDFLLQFIHFLQSKASLCNFVSYQKYPLDSIEIIKNIEVKYKFMLHMEELFKHCEYYMESCETMALQKQQKKESGWIMQKRLFPNLYSNDKGHLYEGQFEFIEGLSKEQKQDVCKKYRRNFGSFQSKEKVYVLVERSSSPVSVRYNYLHH